MYVVITSVSLGNKSTKRSLCLSHTDLTKNPYPFFIYWETLEVLMIRSTILFVPLYAVWHKNNPFRDPDV